MTSILERPDKILYAENETPPPGITILLAITHVALIFDAVVFIPNVLGKVTGATPEQIRFSCFVTILVSALCTLIQVLKVGRLGTGFILFMGSYSAFLACSIDAANVGGLALVSTMTLLAVPVVLLFSYFFKYLRHIVTPAVGGILIILVGVNLIPIGLELWHGGDTLRADYGSLPNHIVGLVTLGTLLSLMIFGNRAIRLWTPLIGLGAGYAAAGFFGLLHLQNFHESALFGFPEIAWPGLAMDLEWSYLPLFAAFSMAALAGSIEGTGNIMLVQSVSRRDKRISYDRIQSGLYCDGFGKFLSGLGGGAPISTYCDNIPLIEMTGVASKSVGICGAFFLGLLAFVPKAGAIVLDMPSPVIGGMLIAIAAMLFYSGIGLVMASGLNNQTGLMLGVSITVGMIAEAEIFFPNLMPLPLSPLLKNGVAMGGFTAFTLSALIRLAPRQKTSFSVAATPMALPDLMKALEGVAPQLKLSNAETKRMELACEETFMHLISGIKGKNPSVLFKFVRTEQGVFTEVIIGNCVKDIVNLTLPSNLMAADEEAIQHLGMFLLSKIVREIRHIQISGVTYISFIA